MVFKIENIHENPANAMRRIGYSFQRQEGEEMSFVRPLARQGYPRFHIYTKMQGSDLRISIHLDQKRETYGKDTRHHGEYSDDGALGEEVHRIQNLLQPSPSKTAFEPL